MSAETLAAGIAIAFLAGACYSVTGFGFALVMTPLLTLAWDVKPAVVTSVVLSTAALVPLLVEVGAHVPVSRASFLVLGSFAEIPLGVAVLEGLDASALQVLVASTVIDASLLLYFAPQIQDGRESPQGQLATGFVSGVVGGSTSMGGPPIVLYLWPRARCEVLPGHSAGVFPAGERVADRDPCSRGTDHRGSASAFRRRAPGRYLASWRGRPSAVA